MRNTVFNNILFNSVNFWPMSTTFDRLLDAARAKFPDLVQNRSDLARFLNESPQSISNWEKRGVPKAKLTDLGQRLGVTAEWLDKGKMEPDASWGPSIKTPFRPIRAIDNIDEAEHDIFEVPRYTLKASAGHGQIVFEVDEVGQPNYMRMNWLKREGWKKDELFSIVVVGDSMEPRIPDGSSVTVHKQPNIVNGKVHVLCRDGECYVKRLFKQFDGSLLVRSDNQVGYKDVIIAPEDLESVHIVGLVVSVSFNI